MKPILYSEIKNILITLTGFWMGMATMGVFLLPNTNHILFVIPFYIGGIIAIIKIKSIMNWIYGKKFKITENYNAE